MFMDAIEKTRGISPSLMCEDSFLLDQTIDVLNRLDIPWFHIDFMDGHFVPNIGMNLNFIRDLRKKTGKPIEVHLMCSSPLEWIDRVIEKGADAVSFHIEATSSPIRCLGRIREKGALAGVALSPATSPENLLYYLDRIDFITLMGVEPGFEGQQFLPVTFQKTEETRRLLQTRKSSACIQVDGGIDISIGKKLLEKGADILVGGVPTLFRNEKLQENFELFNSLF